MAHTFSVTKLAGHRALVEGSDSAGVAHSAILDSTVFDEIEEHQAHEMATDAYDAAVEAFFAPLMEAAAAAADQMAPVVDPAFIYVVDEGQPHSAGRAGTVLELDHPTAVLRLIALGDTSRLIWVGDSIEVLEFIQPKLEATDAPFDWHDQYQGGTILKPGDPDVDDFDLSIEFTPQGDEAGA